MTKKQKRLKKKHGTPKEFADAIWEAFADLWCTHAEAVAAIRKYEDEWHEAGKAKR